MKIGFVSKYFKKPEEMSFGPYPLIYNIVKGISQKENVFVVTAGWPKKPWTDSTGGITVYRTPSVPRDVLRLRFASIGFFGLGRTIREKPDVVNSQTHAGAFLFKKMKRTGIPRIFSVKSLTRGWLDGENPAIKPTKSDMVIINARTFWDDMAIENSDYYIVPSAFAKKELENLYSINEERIKIIYNGVDTEKFKPFQKEDSNPTLFFAGGESYRKNAETAVKTFILLKKDFPKLRLIVTGSGKMQRFRETFEKNRIVLGKDVLTFDRIPHNKMAYYLNQSDVLIHPSSHETFGSVVAEAMSCGKAVVAADNTALTEVVGNAGVLADGKDYKAFADKVAMLISDKKKRDKIGKNARARAVGKLSLKRTINEYTDFFEAIV